MKIAVVGSRTYKRLQDVREFVQEIHSSDLLLSGGARGVDKTAEDEGLKRGLEVVSYRPVEGPPRKWKIVRISWTTPAINSHVWVLDGTYLSFVAAAYARNNILAEQADLVKAFWDGESKGTLSTIRYAQKMGKQVEVVH